MCNPFFIGDSFREAEHINSEFRIPHSEFRIPNSAFRIPNSEFRIPNSEFQIYLIASFIDLTYS